METYLLQQILKTLSEGKVAELIAYILIFVFIWLEVRGMKKELHTLNTTVTGSLKAGELRFGKIEDTQLKFEHRVTELETFLNETHTRIYILENKKGETKT